jgi:hypothetical protein
MARALVAEYKAEKRAAGKKASAATKSKNAVPIL